MAYIFPGTEMMMRSPREETAAAARDRNARNPDSKPLQPTSNAAGPDASSLERLFLSHKKGAASPKAVSAVPSKTKTSISAARPESRPCDEDASMLRQREQAASEMILFDLEMLSSDEASDSVRTALLKELLAILPAKARTVAQARRAGYSWREIADAHGETPAESQKSFHAAIDAALLKMRFSLGDNP